ncbi:MAG: CDP-alcohol phosphatidyltransferase family protein [Caldilineaceae bacterium]
MNNKLVVSQQNLTEGRALAILRRYWIGVAFVYLTIWWLGYRYLAASWQPITANQWSMGAGLMGLIVLGLLWQGLRQNRPSEDEPLWSTLGYGNGLSLARGLLLTLFTGFLFLPRPPGVLAWLPALLLTADRLLDLFDGYVARITGRESKLGAMLDIEFDGLDVLVAVLLGIQYGMLPAWYLVLAVSRQLFVAGMWLRRRAGKPNRDLPPSDNRRPIAGFQTGFLCVMLWPILPPALSNVAAILFAIPLCFSFGRDWLVVSHLIDPAATHYQQGRRWIKRIFEEWLPLLARVSIMLLVSTALWREWPDFPHWQRYFSQSGVNMAPPLLAALAFSFLTLAMLVLCGLSARVAALLLLLLVILDMQINGFLWSDNGLLLISTVIILHLGSGPLSLWRPEEHFLHTRFGKR